MHCEVGDFPDIGPVEDIFSLPSFKQDIREKFWPLSVRTILKN